MGRPCLIDGAEPQGEGCRYAAIVPRIGEWKKSAVNKTEFRNALDAPWTSMTPVRVGQVHLGVGTPATHVTVDHDGAPVLRVDVFESEPAAHAFQDALKWRDFVVIGFGSHVHLVSLTTRSSSSFALDGYFGHLYPIDDKLLVADAERLRCFDDDGSPIWTSVPLGLDGVLVHRVGAGVVEGEGEWDPPGGWRAFRLLLSSGQPLPER